MMNVVAIGFLLSYLGAIVVLVPDSQLTQADRQAIDDYGSSEIFQSAKDAVHSSFPQSPPPSAFNKVKDKMHQGYEKTVDGMESAKESGKDTVERAKDAIESAKEKMQQGYEKTVDGVESAKDYARETAEDAYDRAKQAGKAAYQQIPTKEEAASHIPSKEAGTEYMESLRKKLDEARARLQQSTPSIDDGKEAGKEAMETLKRKVEDIRQQVSAYMQSAPSIDHGKEVSKEALENLKRKIDDVRKQISSHMQSATLVGGGKEASKETMEALKRKIEDVRQQVSSYMPGTKEEEPETTFQDMKKKLEEMSSYIPTTEEAPSYVQPNKETIEELKTKVEGMQERIKDAASSYMHRDKDDHGGAGAGSYGYKEKLEGMLHGVKEKFTGRKRPVSGDTLERKVVEFCSWVGSGSDVTTGKAADGGDMGGAGRDGGKLDVNALRESYVYLMESAVRAIGGAQEVFERAVLVNGGEWREKFMYLSQSATGALERAMEVFERAAMEAEGTDRTPMSKISRGGGLLMTNMTKLKQRAAQTKHHISATIRPLIRMLYLATFSIVYGVTLWMTFFSGHLLSKAVPRQQLGFLQSKLFPAYLRLASTCLAICTVLHLSLHPWNSVDPQDRWQFFNFLSILAASLINTLVVEPRATKVMFEKLKVEKEEGRGQSSADELDEPAKARMAAIDDKFRGLHQCVSCLNLANLAGLSWHLWYLANRLVL